MVGDARDRRTRPECDIQVADRGTSHRSARAAHTLNIPWAPWAPYVAIGVRHCCPKPVIRISLQGRDPTIAILVELARQLNGVRGDKGGRLMTAASVCVYATKD